MSATRRALAASLLVASSCSPNPAPLPTEAAARRGMEISALRQVALVDKMPAEFKKGACEMGAEYVATLGELATRAVIECGAALYDSAAAHAREALASVETNPPQTDAP